APQDPQDVANPARPSDAVGTVRNIDPDAAATVVRDGAQGVRWASPKERAAALSRAADLYEAEAGTLFALAAREAGKTPLDAVGEVREAVDFLRYYAAEAERLGAEPRGVVVAISPWNFPLAIFTGQIAAALAAGNAVVAKPAEQTPLIAAFATGLLHQAGVPVAALQLCPGGGTVGAALVAEPSLAGVAFTGSTATAQRIDRQLAQTAPQARLVAETGGLNAMVVDSTALPEQAVRDIVVSAFQSAGQRCSALRILYIQEDVKDRILDMLTGAMDTLVIGDPWRRETDVGPVIDADAKAKIEAHVRAAAEDGRLLKRVGCDDGLFVPPTLIAVRGIEDLHEEIFGPVLHVATYKAEDIEAVVDAINATGYGLTFGLHTRIDDRVDQVVRRIRVGNIYVNRNQIGAIVGSQPFGGEGRSGTGPKAGGPHTVSAWAHCDRHTMATDTGRAATPEGVQEAIDRLSIDDHPLATEDLPGPTGESNRLSIHPRGIALCLGPTVDRANAQAAKARQSGNGAVIIAPGATPNGDGMVAAVDGVLDPAALSRLQGFAAVYIEAAPGPVRKALAARNGPIVPVLSAGEAAVIERHLCIDTAAAGGNARLLATTED
ncbi:MAG: L-glutamate gamma-semialdehyde dehydrogenase, partial [Pseudomonadota bacterium]